VAFLLRLGYVLTLGECRYWEDEFDYMSLGHSLASGHGYVNPDGSATAFRPIGYPLFLALLNIMGLGQPMEIRLVQVILAVFAVWLVYRLALFLLPGRFAVLAAAYAAIYPYFIFTSGTLLATTWFSTTLLAFMFCFLQGEKTNSWWLFGISGLFLGISALSVTTAVVFAPVVLLWLFFKRKSLKSVLKPTVVFTIAFLSLLLPWMVRNQFNLGIFALSTNGGRNLWLGNNPQATLNTGSDIAMPASLQQQIDAVDEVAADRIYTETALSFIREDKSRFLRFSLLKGIGLWRPDPSPTTPGYVADYSLLRWMSILTYSPILLLGIAALFFAERSQKLILRLWSVIFVVFTGVHAPYISKVRFRLPLDHFLMIMAVLMVYMIVKRIERHKMSIALINVNTGIHDENHSP